MSECLVDRWVYYMSSSCIAYSIPPDVRRYTEKEEKEVEINLFGNVPISTHGYKATNSFFIFFEFMTNS